MKNFPYTVVYTNNRNAYAKIQEDGSLLFSIPQRCKYNEKIFNALLEQGEKLFFRHSQRPQLQRWDQRWLHLFGEKVGWEDTPISFSDSTVIKEKYLKTQLYEYAIEWVEIFTQQIGVSCFSLSIRKAKSRWWSCSHDGKLMLNLSLAHLPWKYIQYVIAHEVAHLLHHHHQKPFWELVKKLFPTYIDTRKELKKLNIF